jgi:hypothetical protein
MTTEERRADTLRRIMPVAFAIIEIATGNDCHQQHIDRYDQCNYFHNAGSNIGQSSDLFVMKDCNTVVSRKERHTDVPVWQSSMAFLIILPVAVQPTAPHRK